MNGSTRGPSLREIEAMREAYRVATDSPDRSTQNGAVVLGYRQVVSACNRFVRGVDPDDEAVHERPLKYRLIVHAEDRVILRAAHLGVSTAGRTMVACWAACPACAQSIVESRISRLVVHKDRMDATPERWKTEVDLGLKMLGDAGVEVAMIAGPVNAGVQVRFNGELIDA